MATTKNEDSQERKTVRLPLSVYEVVRQNAFNEKMPIVRWIAKAVEHYAKHRAKARARKK